MGYYWLLLCGWFSMAEEDNLEARNFAMQQGRYYPSPQDKYGSALIMMTDPTNDLYRYELFLRNLRETVDQNGQTVLKQAGDQLMNEEGINTFMSMIESVVFQLNSMSNFNENDLRFFYDTLKSDLIETVMVNRRRFAIDRKNRNVLVGNSLRFAYSFTKKSFEEGERGFWKGSVVENRLMTDKPSGHKMSLNPFSLFKRN